MLIAPDGATLAVRTADGRLAIVKAGSDIFATREWLAADADPRAPKDTLLTEGFTCDKIGCIGRLADGAMVAFARSIEAFEEDCRRAALVVSARPAPPDCAATVIDRTTLRRYGAVALRRVGGSFEVVPSRPAGYDRPWAHAVPGATARPVDPSGSTTKSLPRDATPKPEELDVGD